MVNVLQLMDYGAAYSGNFVNAFKVLSDILEKRGHRQVWVFSNLAKDHTWIDDLRESGEIVYILPDTKNIWSLAIAINKIANKENATILHTHFTTYDVPAWIARLLALLKGTFVKVIWHVHSPFPVEPSLTRAIKDFVKFRVLGRYVRTVPVSEGGVLNLIDRGLIEANTTVIPNGIDIDHALISVRTREETRSNLRIGSTERVVLMFGWDPYRKGVDVAVEALRCLRGKYDDLVLLLVGGEKLLQFLNGSISTYEMDWLRTAEPVEFVGDYYQCADVFLSASRAEGFSYAVGEAMANGLTVVSSNIRGLEWIKKVEGVMFFESENVDSLIWTLESSFNKIRSNNKIPDDNRRFIQENFSAIAWATKVVELYEEVIGEGSNE